MFIGFGFAPIVGGALYDMLGFSWTFYLIGLMTMMAGLFVFLFPENVDKKHENL